MRFELILILLAALCFFIAAVGVPMARVNLVALGLFFWVLTLLISG